MKYEPKDGYFGQFNTDLLIELHFLDKIRDGFGEPGVCVEVGAANGVRGSNTLRFERLGWRAICIEPNPAFAQSLAQNRNEFYICACGSHYVRSATLTVFDIGEKHIMSSVSSLSPDDRLIADHKSLINERRTVRTDVFTLDTVLSRAGGVDRIDFVSIDTEGTELAVLQGFDVARWNVPLLVVENNYDDKGISEYLTQFGYHRSARWQINDFYTKTV